LLSDAPSQATLTALRFLDIARVTPLTASIKASLC